MIEKRFRMETIGDVMLPCIVDNSTAKKESDTITTYHTYETHRKEKCLELVDLLNDLSEENKQLKIRFNEEREKSLKFCRNIDTLTIENEHLKNHIQELQNHLKRLENENEQIKQVIKEAYETERTHIGKSVLKQLLNNIGEI